MTIDSIASELIQLTELIESGNFAIALQRAQSLLQQHPRHSELWRLLALCQLQQNELSAAQNALLRALELSPESAEAWCNLASVYNAYGNMNAAEQALRKALQLYPQHAPAWNNLGRLRDAHGDYIGAVDCFAQAIANQPDYAHAWLNQAATQLALQHLDHAEISVRRALALLPEWSDAYFVLGNILNQPGHTQEACAAYRHAVRLAPNNIHYQQCLAQLLEDQGDWSAAAQLCEQMLSSAPQFFPALSQLVFLKRRLCDWTNLEPFQQRLIEAVQRGAPGIAPFAFLAEPASPAQQLACARTFAKNLGTEIAPLIAQQQPVSHSSIQRPIRIGFWAAGFGEHPTALLIVELIEQLCNSSLHTIGLAISTDDQGPLRQRLKAAFHEFHDLSGQSVPQLAQALDARNLDILLDLDGYCGGSIPELFALKRVPIQVNWLAYPGSLGADWYDYLIADRFVIPAHARVHYSEALALLPRCFQPSDTTRQVGIPPEKHQLGLPEKSIIFSSFNNSYKINPKCFQQWMTILNRVPDSVLWLLSGPPGTPVDNNLRHAAQSAGVNPQRLIFNPKLPHAEYLACYRHADLFLDTSPYNAHTTASDALWAGCPVLTQPGATFAARVAGSLNHHLGLSELNAESGQAYLEQAIRLAEHRDVLEALRQRLQTAKQQTNVFDMAGYARDFETMLLCMVERYKSGAPSEDLIVSATPHRID